MTTTRSERYFCFVPRSCDDIAHRFMSSHKQTDSVYVFPFCSLPFFFFASVDLRDAAQRYNGRILMSPRVMYFHVVVC